jgi:hypothetical protein
MFLSRAQSGDEDSASKRFDLVGKTISHYRIPQRLGIRVPASRHPSSMLYKLALSESGWISGKFVGNLSPID